MTKANVGGILVLLFWLLASLVIPITALVVNGQWLFAMFWAVCWAAAMWPGRKSRRGEPATPPPVETVVPPPVELPRTFTVRSGLRCALAVLVLGAIVYGTFAFTPLDPASWRWVPGCMSALALIGWAYFGTMRITCTKQDITMSSRRLLGGLYRRNCRWSYVTATTYTYDPGGPGGSAHETFAVETSEGPVVRMNDAWGNSFEEFVAICNAHTPHLPYIWVRPPYCPPRFIRVQRNQGAP